jgi:ATP-dependent DNA helicase RecG
MTRDELIARLKGYEWTDFECKKAHRDVPKDAYSTVSAFANTQGGWVLFGVSEDKGRLEVSGVDPAAFDRVQDAFLTTLRSGQKLNSVISADPHVYDLDGKQILAFFIAEVDRHQKPVYLNGNPRDSFIRRAARDERMTDIELQRFLRDAAQQSWDGETVADFPVESSIDIDTLNWYQEQFVRRNPEQRQINDPIEFLLEWNFIRHQSGKPLLTRAAILLFGLDRCVRALLPRPVLDYQRIDTGFESWSAEERWHDRLVFEENLFKTWRALVTKYSRIAEHPFKVDPATMRRNDDPPDYIAFREATINLLIHQDYGDLNRKASLKLFTDRLLFWNPGDAFATTAQLLESNEKEIRNPLVVNAFRRIGLSDQAGTGIRAILRNWHELGRRPPEITNDKAGKSFELSLRHEPQVTEAMSRFQASLGVHLSPEQADVLALAADQESFSVVDAGMSTGANLKSAHDALKYLCQQQLLIPLDDDTFALAAPIRVRLERFNLEQPQSQNTSHPTSTQQVPDKCPASVGQVIKVLQTTGPEMSRAELQDALSLTDREHFSKEYLKPALASGLVEMTIPDKPRSSKQRYRLTDKGHSMVEGK